MGSNTHARQDTSPAEGGHGRTTSTPPVSGPATAVQSPAYDAPQDPGFGPSEAQPQQQGGRKKPKKKKNRNRRRRDRRPSFLGPEDSDSHAVAGEGAEPETERRERTPFFRSRRRSYSSTSLESEALLDHRFVSLINMLDPFMKLRGLGTNLKCAPVVTVASLSRSARSRLLDLDRMSKVPYLDDRPGASGARMTSVMSRRKK